MSDPRYSARSEPWIGALYTILGSTRYLDGSPWPQRINRTTPFAVKNATQKADGVDLWTKQKWPVLAVKVVRYNKPVVVPIAPFKVTVHPGIALKDAIVGRRINIADSVFDNEHWHVIDRMILVQWHTEDVRGLASIARAQRSRSRQSLKTL